MVRVAIIGGSGYTGLELIRLLVRHPGVDLTAVTSREYNGKPVSLAFPALAGVCHLTFSWPDPDRLAGAADLFFVALPHKTAMAVIPSLLEAGGKVVDLSADFRFRDRKVYEEWYQEHTAPELLAEAVYGLPELYREEIKRARLVGNPGCYPTSVILGLAPLLHAGLIESQGIIADCKSGASGAGRGVSLSTLYCEVNEGFRAYKIAEHRHTPEMEQELGRLAGLPLKITFTPHLVPMNRGILATLYTVLQGPLEEQEIAAVFEQFYRGAPFIRLCPPEILPNTAAVRGSNYCDLAWRLDQRTGRLIVVSAIDNLTRGASGQAVHNMNLMLGFPETQGLEVVPFLP
ncbi:N-acetyl-gamma-glutamyl-phosphate reductase [Desulfobacca acetoxidans]|uniref:N-acetyl-gamma-glutamyl-phosphate reductase n=1 Tax=Desulfobacca acetoxidans (strain ATCC 700848 / DSM 11109 / ASRB2) TaxID=880072 RepID=F2NBV8_DESAR|nr:N-acetyl-gamma-glutamyl-phosphate reductase [Desulfobacca acetoxidans]AEB08035.1 N-acetyl-gamma-glutamyl-phosphate reductase [Desulfobacca acetoxidans DSM 11109]HAY20679.1 N-acetyl-gamma-glutamyl-phosphate reductase [Desulfobacterales bacterium]